MLTPTSQPPAGDGPGAPARPFRWADVPPEDRDWLRRRTEDVTGTAYRIGCDFARLGVALAEVRARLKRRSFRAWLAAETPFSRAHAYRLIRVGAAFGGYVSKIETLDEGALYLLSNPAVPVPVREAAVAAAADGPVTRAAALELIRAHRAPAFATATEETGFAADLAARMGPVREAEQARRKGAAREESPEQRAGRMARVGEALLKLAAECSVVHVTKIEDEDDEPLVSVTAYREDDTPRNAVRSDLLSALLAVADREPAKACPTCRATKPLSKFGVLRSAADGRNRCCKVCERARIAAHKREKKARKRAAAAAPGAAPTP